MLKNKLNLTQKQLEMIAEILKTILLCLVIITVFTILKVFFVQPVKVEGDSMQPSIESDDILLINKITPKDSYERYDVIVFKPYNEDDPSTKEDETEFLYIKRIIGLPGEKVRVAEDGRVYISSSETNEILLQDDIYGNSSTVFGIDWIQTDDNVFESIILGENEYFVLGDNRGVSLDSRSERIQAVNTNSILGKYLIRIYPFV